MTATSARRKQVSRIVLALCAAATPTLHAQFAAYDFVSTGCANERGLLRAGFEDRDIVSPTGGPSGGSGGAFPGPQSLTVTSPAGTHAALLHVPGAYTADQAWPLVVALPGAAGSAAAAPAAANQIRALWAPVAEREGALVVVPIASGTQGGWVPGIDQPAVACALDRVARDYNIDLDRRYLWGYSAGAHFGHALALGNPGRFAAYAINAGALEVLSCSAGGAYACATTLPQIARRIPASLRVGESDPLRAHAQADANRFRAAGWVEPDRLGHAEFFGGHTVDAAEVEAAWAWFAPRRLPD